MPDVQNPFTLVQYCERYRLEFHPASSVVEIGRLGVQEAQMRDYLAALSARPFVWHGMCGRLSDRCMTHSPLCRSGGMADAADLNSAGE